jgi:divalent metal cation (Fe/Co/Zn/Cd) transporter
MKGYRTPADMEPILKATQIVLLIVALIIIFIGALFTVQNGGRLTGLSLSLGFPGTGFQLAQPLPVPWLMWIAFGVGLSVGGGWGLWQRFASGQQIRELQRKLARSSSGSGNDPWKS